MKKLIVWVLLAFSIYIAVFGGEYSVLEVRRVRQEQSRLVQQLNDLKQENDSLIIYAEELEFDSARIEEVARTRYGIIRPGETVYIIAAPKDSVNNF